MTLDTRHIQYQTIDQPLPEISLFRHVYHAWTHGQLRIERATYSFWQGWSISLSSATEYHPSLETHWLCVKIEIKWYRNNQPYCKPYQNIKFLWKKRCILSSCLCGLAVALQYTHAPNWNMDFVSRKAVWRALGPLAVLRECYFNLNIYWRNHNGEWTSQYCYGKRALLLKHYNTNTQGGLSNQKEWKTCLAFWDSTIVTWHLWN